MSIESAPNRGKVVSEALGTIAGIETQTNQLGGNDTEREQFTILKRDVELGKITPEEGIQKATAILENKNSNYH